MIRARYGKTARRLLLGAGVLALVIPTLAGCEAGNDAPTLQFHPAAAGAQATVNGIQISDAFVLGGPDGAALPPGSKAGLFVSFYNGGTGADTLQNATAAGASGVTLAGGSVSLPLNSAVNLTGPQPSAVLTNLTAPLVAGGTVNVTFQFAHAGKVTVSVPVEARSYYWSTYSPPASSPAPPVSPSATPAVTGATPSGSGQPTVGGKAGAGSSSPAASASAS